MKQRQPYGAVTGLIEQLRPKEVKTVHGIEPNSLRMAGKKVGVKLRIWQSVKTPGAVCVQLAND